MRIDRVFRERYSVQGIKERIYYKEKEKIPVANLTKKYYRKAYTGPKINRLLLKTSSFYRLYVHYLYFFGKLPAKNQYKELTPEYYKQKRKNNIIFEEIKANYMKEIKARNHVIDLVKYSKKEKSI